MTRLALAAALLAATLPAAAQAQEAPPPPAATHAAKGRWFVGGGFGATFGSVNSISIAPLLGYHVVPRVDVGTQLFYRWVDDHRYAPSVTTNDYGATLFVRARIVFHLFAEANYQFTNTEYKTGNGTARSTYNTVLAGGGYGFPLGRAASLYVSALYDFLYNANAQNVAYDNPWRVQIGVTVGF